MRILLLLLVNLSLLLPALGQKSAKVYLNDKYEKCNEMIAIYYRLTSVDDKKQYHGITEDYTKDDKIKNRGFYSHGNKVGMWEEYADGTIIKRRHYKSDTLKFTINEIMEPKDTTWQNPDTEAMHPDGKDGLLGHMLRQPYPDIAVANKLQGKVLVKFVIERNGEVSNIEVLKTSNIKILDDAAVKHIKKLPKFEPARDDSHKVRQSVMVPVIFSLKKKKN